jgi:hypothetical protein
MATITLVLNDAEQQAFHQLIDSALRSNGISALQVGYHFASLINSAQATAAQAAPPANASASAPSTPSPAPRNARVLDDAGLRPQAVTPTAPIAEMPMPPSNVQPVKTAAAAVAAVPAQKIAQPFVERPNPIVPPAGTAKEAAGVFGEIASVFGLNGERTATTEAKGPSEPALKPHAPTAAPAPKPAS